MNDLFVLEMALITAENVSNFKKFKFRLSSKMRKKIKWNSQSLIITCHKFIFILIWASICQTEISLNFFIFFSIEIFFLYFYLYRYWKEKINIGASLMNGRCVILLSKTNHPERKYYDLKSGLQNEKRMKHFL